MAGEVDERENLHSLLGEGQDIGVGSGHLTPVQRAAIRDTRDQSNLGVCFAAVISFESLIKRNRVNKISIFGIEDKVNESTEETDSGNANKKETDQQRRLTKTRT